MFLFFFVIGLKNYYDDAKVKKYGEIITVTITHVPTCIGTKTPHHFRFEYIDNEELFEYSKRVGVNRCGELYEGMKIKLKADLKTKNFLYLNENIEINFYSSILLGLFGMFLIIKAIFKSNSTQQQV
jgi:hypothetical protein